VIDPAGARKKAWDEPPNHPDCASFSVKTCPFIANPRMTRNRNNVPPTIKINEIPSHPPIYGIWTTTNSLVEPCDGGIRTRYLLGPPEQLTWFKEGKPILPNADK
jgi:hypothetical protein